MNTVTFFANKLDNIEKRRVFTHDALMFLGAYPERRTDAWLEGFYERCLAGWEEGNQVKTAHEETRKANCLGCWFN